MIINVTVKVKNQGCDFVFTWEYTWSGYFLHGGFNYCKLKTVRMTFWHTANAECWFIFLVAGMLRLLAFLFIPPGLSQLSGYKLLAVASSGDDCKLAKFSEETWNRALASRDNISFAAVLMALLEKSLRIKMTSSGKLVKRVAGKSQVVGKLSAVTKAWLS